MINTAFNWLEYRLVNGSWFRRGIVAVVIYMTFRLTEWGMHFADHALADKAELLGAGTILTAVTGIPLALLTMVFKWYTESRPTDPNVPSS